MRTSLAVIITLALGALATNFLLQDNGYVLISLRGYAVEMSLPVLLLMLILIYAAVRVCIHILTAPRKLGEMTARYRQRTAGARMTRGYIAMSEGNFARGEKLLTRGVRSSEAPLLNYLTAARAAEAQGDHERRDTWLRMAFDQEPKAETAVLLTKAELQLQNEEYAAARTTLNSALVKAPNSPQALRLKASVCIRLEDWDELEGLLPRLRKKGKVAAEQLDAWFVQTWSALLEQAASDPHRLKQLWKTLPRHLRFNGQLIHARVNALVADGQLTEAEVIVRKALVKEWSDELIRLYGQLEADAGAQLKVVEGWLIKRPEDAVLLLTAARLCVRNELWGKARSYFETSNAIQPSAETWHDLGQLMLHIGDYEAASRSFETGLTLTYGATDVPRLEADQD